MLKIGPRHSDYICANKIIHAHMSHHIAIIHIIKMLEWLLELSRISSGHVLGDSPHQVTF